MAYPIRLFTYSIVNSASLMHYFHIHIDEGSLSDAALRHGQANPRALSRLGAAYPRLHGGDETTSRDYCGHRESEDAARQARVRERPAPQADWPELSERCGAGADRGGDEDAPSWLGGSPSVEWRRRKSGVPNWGRNQAWRTALLRASRKHMFMRQPLQWPQWAAWHLQQGEGERARVVRADPEQGIRPAGLQAVTD